MSGVKKRVMQIVLENVVGLYYSDLYTSAERLKEEYGYSLDSRLSNDLLGSKSDIKDAVVALEEEFSI